MTRIVALVPARGGSRGIPGKNIRPLAGRPLIHWVLDALVSVPQIDAIYVSSDSEPIRRSALEFQSQRVYAIERAQNTATDTASTESVMLDFCERVSFDQIILVQATSPLLEAGHIQAGLTAMTQGYDSVLSVVRQHRFMWEDDPLGARALNYDPSKRPRRQDWAGVLVENGAFYITSRERLMSSRCRLSGKIGLVEMPERTYTELDTETDWGIVERLVEYHPPQHNADQDDVDDL